MKYRHDFLIKNKIEVCHIAFLYFENLVQIGFFPLTKDGFVFIRLNLKWIPNQASSHAATSRTFDENLIQGFSGRDN